MFPPENTVIRGSTLLITDELASPADFLLHHFLLDHLKDSSSSSKCTFIAVSESFNKWKTLCGKSNTNLTRLISNRSLVWIDVASHIPETIAPGISQLRPLYDKILDEASDEHGHNLVILDDISSLEWTGIPLQDILRFARALTALCRKSNASLIIRHHIITPGEPDDIFRLLLQICNYHLEVFPLSTGRSGNVSGQLALHPGPAQIDQVCRPIPRSRAVHYRLSDTDCAFFDRGTSSGVL